MRRIYPLDGKEFSSIKQLAAYTGIHEKTLSKRLQRGMSLEEACKKTDLRCRYYDIGGVTKSRTQICREQKKDSRLINNRMKYGYSLQDALNKPKEIRKQGYEIVVNGILYNSIAEALRENQLTHKESTVRRRLKSGMNPDAAFSFSDKPETEVEPVIKGPI